MEDDSRPIWHEDAVTLAKVLAALQEQRLVDVTEQIASTTPDRFVLPSHVEAAALAMNLFRQRPDRSSDVLTAGLTLFTSGACLAAGMTVVIVPARYWWIEPAGVGAGLVGLLLCGVALGIRYSHRTARSKRRAWSNALQDLYRR